MHYESCTAVADDPDVRALGCTCVLGHKPEKRSQLPVDFQLAVLALAGAYVYVVHRAWQLGKVDAGVLDVR